MFTIKINNEKNRLYLKLGTIEPGEAERIFTGLRSQLNRLPREFSGVFDISDFKVNAPEEVAWAQKIIKLLADAGMGVSARVIGAKSKRRRMLGRHSKPVVIVETVARADYILDRLSKPGR